MNKIYRPDYYDEFKCIAGDCNHSCCIGWDIDIDPVSMKRFSEHGYILKNIKDRSMMKDKDGRCLFLNGDGLCDMILRYGEDMLCDICREHPRFYNRYDDHTDMGVGLCCEEVCNIVLHKTDKFKLIPEREMSEEIKTIQNRELPFNQRLQMLGPSRTGAKMRALIFKQLERLDEDWTSILDDIIAAPPDEGEISAYLTAHGIPMEQLVCYFLYRYPDKTWFATEGIRLIASACLCSKSKTMCDIVRLFSSEVEYSDSNIGELESIYA